MEQISQASFSFSLKESENEMREIMGLLISQIAEKVSIPLSINSPKRISISL